MSESRQENPVFAEDDASAEMRIVARSMQQREIDMLDRDREVHTGAGRFLERVEALMRPDPLVDRG